MLLYTKTVNDLYTTLQYSLHSHCAYKLCSFKHSFLLLKLLKIHKNLQNLYPLPWKISSYMWRDAGILTRDAATDRSLLPLSYTPIPLIPPWFDCHFSEASRLSSTSWANPALSLKTSRKNTLMISVMISTSILTMLNIQLFSHLYSMNPATLGDGILSHQMKL